MATKTFKIGLSNTDKQNMAQDVYERVLALTFAEYDSANTYNKGDFVVYEDTLYQCKQDNTTGAWDSSKWQQATLQDLLNDIEGAVAFVNDKANVDGNYPTMTVGAADNLTPYGKDSGVDQEQPFLLQGTGCGNGEQQVDTGALGLLKEKQGNTVVVNQKVKNGDFSESSNWSVSSGTLNIANNKATITANANATNVEMYQPLSIPSGHKFLSMFTVKASVQLDAIRFGGVGSNHLTNPTTGGTYYFVDTVSSGQRYFDMYFYKTTFEGGETIEVTNCATIDLTQWFGSNDNIPAHLLAHPEDFFRYYQGSLAYNEGTLVNANGRYLKTIGRNQWDEEIEGAYIDTDTGANTPQDNSFRSKNYIKVVPNGSYHFRRSNTVIGTAKIYEYDKDKNFIQSFTVVGSDTTTNTFDVSPNTCYIRFAIYLADSGWGSNPPSKETAQITISLYYEGESGYDQYYPYEELANIDTGTEVLRSAGSVKDSKAPDGTITRRIGVVDLGTLSWTYSAGTFFTEDIDSLIKTVNSAQLATLICSKYTLATANDVVLQNVDKAIGFNAYYHLIVGDSNAGTDAQAFKTAMSGVYLFYELAEPTTEQGTTFSENIAIDDFGSMDFSGTNGVPQGASIFYAVDYKAFIDSLYNTLDGDATDVVKESELDSKLATLGYVKLTSVSGYDATKTQVLKNVEGTLTWVTEE